MILLHPLDEKLSLIDIKGFYSFLTTKCMLDMPSLKIIIHTGVLCPAKWLLATTRELIVLYQTKVFI